jgi:hypothetical protein
MHKLFLVSVLALAPVAASASIQSHAGGFSPEKGLDANASASFEAQRAAIVEALGDGKTYSEISAEDRNRVTAALDRMSGLLQGVQNVDQLSENNRVEVFNEQETVNTVLTQAREDSRLVCSREKKVGSNRTTSSCMTVAERRRAREDTEQQLNNFNRVLLPASN